MRPTEDITNERAYYGQALIVNEQYYKQATWREQRETCGADETEVWNLDITLARFLIPRLKLFKEKIRNTPENYEKIEDWKDVIQEIIDGFEIIASNSITLLNENIVSNALYLFFANYSNLHYSTSTEKETYFNKDK